MKLPSCGNRRRILSRSIRSKTEGLYIVVTAPSGTGKSSICQKVLEKCACLRFSVSHTTRPARPGEEDGKDYFFISEDEFRKRIGQGEFVEWVEHLGYFYGTSEKKINALWNSGFDIILDLEPRGAKALKERWSQGVFVFILPPSL